MFASPLRPEIHKMTIWESARIDRYIKALLERCGGNPGTRYTCCTKAKRPSELSYLRITGGQMFTQAIFVDPVERGRATAICCSAERSKPARRASRTE